MLHAIIGIGSNSVRLLIADVARQTMTHCHRDRIGTRLFDGLVNGCLTEESMCVSLEAVAQFAQDARAHDCGQLHIMATSATRDASNRAVFAARIQATTGVPLEILSGEQEAYLSYLGGAQHGRSGLIDIGGGSTELTVGEDTHIHASISLQLGAVRLSRAMQITCAGDLPAARAQIDPALRAGWASLAQDKPAHWSGVGGTFTSLAAMDMRLPSLDRTLVEGHVLRRDNVSAWLSLLADMPLSTRRALPGLSPQRADIITHGVAILDSCLRVLDLAEIRVSDHGNLDGYLRYLQLQLPVEQ